MSLMTEAQAVTYKDKLHNMTDDEMGEEVARVVEIAAYNPVYNIHDEMAGYCYDECQSSGRPKVYAFGCALGQGALHVHNEIVRQQERIARLCPGA